MGFVLFGLTGGLASGKSTVAARLRTHGVPVIDADALAREVVLPGTDGLAEIVAVFGPEVQLPDGTLDRPRLAAIVFKDDDKRRRLNSILHPRIGALSMARVAEHRTRGEEVVCYEAPLLVENGLADMFRPLVVVAVPEDVQVARAMLRDDATEDQARARIAAQLPLADKVRAADFVIDNGRSREDTERQTDEVLAKIRERART
ncbi:dephospho-CoA kinase [Chondromyces apiculatus]|uniref:Dephospho-CoA kinase n=1 Tax=Chondromyces apiculatus DSM 436 TaxID=1192034 RepID=A0A017TGU9_9BACT|nr:dephospho-CoA kinase [Chondromyces apiculatus]EYF07846.1 Dephospho-CoA kinase [Chondromyces apiculatus DSM 436]